MKKTSILLMTVIVILVINGCAPMVSNMQPMRVTYPKMYDNNKPITVLILPPINKSTAAEAKEYFSCSLAEPLGLKGYYPIPVEPMFNILRDEGLYDTEVLSPEVYKNFKKFFGADAVLVTKIEKWDKSIGFSGNLDISASYALISTTTAETLWDFRTDTTVILQSNNSNLLGQLIESSIKTAFEDYFPNAYATNMTTMDKYLPTGQKNPKVNLDAENKVPVSKHGTITITK